MKCQVCKLKEATNHQGKLHLCDGCLTELQLSVQYYINGKEVTAEEYYDRINNRGGE